MLVVGALFAGACGTTKSDARAETPVHPGVIPRTPSTQPPPRTTPSTSVPAYSFDGSVPPPKLVNTGTDYVAILKSIESYGNWLAAYHPDPSLVHNIIAAGTREYELLSRDLARLRDNHRRATETLGSPSKYALISVSHDAFTARVIEDIRFHRAIAPTGRVTSQVTFSRPTTYLILAVRSGERWFFAAQDER